MVESKDADSVKAAAQMLKNLQKQYSENWLVTYCENPTINAVLTCKHEERVQANMMLQTTIALPGEIPVENV